MKKLLFTILLVSLPFLAEAQLNTFQGGTGSTSPSGLLYGDSTIRLKTVNIGSNLTFSGGTLSASGGGGGSGFWPFITTNTNYGVAVQSTTTPEWFQGGLFASSTSQILYASTTAISAQSICLTSDICRTTWPTSGSGGSGNVATSTAETAGNLAYWTSTGATPATLGKIATTTTSCTGNISCTSFTAMGAASSISFTGTLPIANGGTNNNGAIGASSTSVLSDGGKYVYYKLSPSNFTTANISQWTNDSGYGTGSVTSVATNAGLTGGAITTTGTIGLDTTAILNGSVLQYNGTRLAATGTPALSVGYLIGTSTATSTFAGGVNMTGNDCFAIQGTCLQTYIQAATAYKSAANYATAAVLPGTPTYSNGSAGVGATLTELGFGALSVDGQVVSIGQRILVKNEATQANNGIYTVTATGSGVASYILTRSTDYNTTNDIYSGTTVPVLSGGTTNGDTQWTESTTGTIVVGTTAIVFQETSYGTNGTVTSVATNAGLTGGPVTTTGTLGLDTSAIVNGLLLQYNGSRLAATGTQALTAGYYIATTTATSTFIGGIDAARVCLTGSTTCLTAGGGGGSGTVSSGVAGQLAFYSSSGTTVLGSSSEQVTLGRFNATSTIASVFPYASTTNISSTQGAQLATAGGGVAIGATTVTAGYKLDVVGGGAQFGGSLALTTGDLNLPGAGNIYFLTRGIISAPTNGELILYNYAGTDFTRLDFGGNTSAFPSLGRTLNSLNVIAGDGTTNAKFGIGTTTPQWSFEMASATPYLAITDTNAPTNSQHWLMSNKDGQLTFGTSSDIFAGTSTAMILDGNGQGLTVGASTTPVTASLALIATEQSTETYSLYIAHSGSSTPSLVVNGVNGNGNVGVASTTPAAQFSVDGTSLFNNTLVNSSTASSTFYGGVDAKRLCLTGTATCLAAPTNFVSTTSVQALSTTTIDVSTLAPAHQFTILFHSSSTSATAVIGMCFNTCPSTDHYITSGLNMDGVATAGFENSTDSYLAFPATNAVAISSDTTIEVTVTNIGNMWKYGIGRNINLNGNGNASQAQFYWKEPDPTVPITKISFTTQSSAKTFGAATFISVSSI